MHRNFKEIVLPWFFHLGGTWGSRSRYTTLLPVLSLPGYRTRQKKIPRKQWSGAFLTPGSGSGMGKNQNPDPGSGSWMNNPDPISTTLWVKILQFFDADPGSRMEKIRIRDKYPGSATLLGKKPYSRWTLSTWAGARRWRPPPASGPPSRPAGSPASGKRLTKQNQVQNHEVLQQFTRWRKIL